MPAKLPNRDLDWPIPWAAVVLLCQAESCRLRSYLCPAGVWTNGWGETDGVKPGMVWTQEYADQRLVHSLGIYTSKVRDLCKVAPTPNQLGALVSLAYNIGLGALAKSSVLRAHNKGDFASAARAFGLWNKARVNGQLTELRGLTTRRAAEAALYLLPEPEEVHEVMPQAVAEESKMTASPIAQGGAVTAGVGALSLVSEAKDTLGPVSETVSLTKNFALDTLGIPHEWFIPALLLAIGALVVWYRLKQRRDGWA